MKKIFGIIMLSLVSLALGSEHQANDSTKSNDVWVNVYIHGIIRPVVDIGDMINISRQKLKQTRYKSVTKYVRKNNVIHRSQPLQEVGLQSIKMEPNPDNNGSRATVAVFKKLKQHIDPSSDTKELFYTFGWSGLLCYGSRQKASFFLYKKLIRLAEKLKLQGLNPKFRIIAFSHGGNVAIQMANFDPWNKLRSQLTIDELITLGMPVQKENDVLIRHPMFSKIYHFYSEGDIPQKLDFVTTDYGSSFRRYQARACFEIPDKLTQIQIRFSKRVNFKSKSSKKDRFDIFTYDPSHIEMWSFGWTPSGYNKKSPAFPFPAASFAPYLVDVISKKPNIGTNLTVDIITNQNKIIITDRHWHNHHTIKKVEVPFISPEDYNELKQIAWTRRPDDNLDLAGKKIVNSAIHFATRQRKLSSHCSKALGCKSKNCNSSCSLNAT